DGKIIYERGYGMAKIEDGIVNTPEKVFDIGSVSKQFTAACMAMLVREGKVKIEDDIRKYLPEMPAYEKPVLVRHLLHHTSGLRDYNALLALAGFREDADSPTVAEAVEVIRRQKKLNYLPGEEYSYTNTGFFLLSQIVERVSGKSLNAFAQERIFKPLGMTKTLFQDDHNQIIKDRATGYGEGEGGTFRISLSNWDETGDGNVYTTVRDLAKWDQAFYSGALGRDLTDMMQTTEPLNSGKKNDYAWGLVVHEYRGLKVVEHGGAWVGFRAQLLRFPDQKFSVMILSNLASFDPFGLALKVADIYLAGQFKTGPGGPRLRRPDLKLPAIKPSAAELASYAGTYMSEELLDARYTMSVKDGQLMMAMRSLPPTVLKAAGKDKFTLPDFGVDIAFTRDKSGKVDGFTLDAGRASGIAFRKGV
ncbi:MAG TPA: serine hydrolase, partial [Candidatus Bathyarchaeia archaeon]|nr:serine hydrolase [Candidatus Bathyarchaeia archaeon]